MVIIGEKINATRKSIAAALKAHDAEAIASVATDQAAAGADYLDINGGDPREGREAENMSWLIDVVQDACDLPLSIDTADAEAMKLGLTKAGHKPIVNSISLEASRLEAGLGLVGEHECTVVALLMSDAGPPTGVDDRVANAERLIGKLTGAGKGMDEIIVDPCFLPVSTDTTGGPNVIRAIAEIRRRWPEVHVGGGVSNISFGLPKRRLINFAALTQAIFHGMDYGIIDPTTPGIIATILAAEAVAGRDEYCMNYVTAEREGRLGQ